jgi:hypothetical protein
MIETVLVDGRPTRLHELLHAARPVLIDLAGAAAPTPSGRADLVPPPRPPAPPGLAGAGARARGAEAGGSSGRPPP